ncbi:MAG: pyrroline-5-carboxylate reductase dimerization domain-containing protein [Nitrospiraceae bacterium]
MATAIAASPVHGRMTVLTHTSVASALRDLPAKTIVVCVGDGTTHDLNLSTLSAQRPDALCVALRIVRSDETAAPVSSTTTVSTPTSTPIAPPIRVISNGAFHSRTAFTAVASDASLSADALARVRTLFEILGDVVVVDSRQYAVIERVLTRSTEAMRQLIDALAAGGQAVGLPDTLAQTLSQQTVHGAATMVRTTGEHPAALKDRVASPAGTTIAGLYTLEQGAFRGGVMAAVDSTVTRPSSNG